MAATPGPLRTAPSASAYLGKTVAYKMETTKDSIAYYADGKEVQIEDWTAAPDSSAVDVQEIHSRIEALLQSYGLK